VISIVQFHARLQRDLDNPFDYDVCFVNDALRSGEPHPVCKPDGMLFVGVQAEPVVEHLELVPSMAIGET